MRIVFNLYICLSENIFNYFVKTLRLRTRIRSLDQSRTRIHIFSLDPQHRLPGSQIFASFTDPDEGSGQIRYQTWDTFQAWLFVYLSHIRSQLVLALFPLLNGWSKSTKNANTDNRRPNSLIHFYPDATSLDYHGSERPKNDNPMGYTD